MKLVILLLILSNCTAASVVNRNTGADIINRKANTELEKTGTLKKETAYELVELNNALVEEVEALRVEKKERETSTFKNIKELALYVIAILILVLLTALALKFLKKRKN